MSDTLVHRHASHGECRTVCGRPCDAVSTAYAHNADTVTCEPCKGRDTSRDAFR